MPPTGASAPPKAPSGPPNDLVLKVSPQELKWLRGLVKWKSERCLVNTYGEDHCFSSWVSGEAWRCALRPAALTSMEFGPPWGAGPLPYFYINLASAVDRRELQETQASAHNLRTVRVTAVHPPFSPEVLAMYGERMMFGPMDDNSDAQLANAIVLSFLQALRAAVLEAAPFCIISEDDAMPLLDFRARLEALWRSAPRDVQGLCLHSSSLAIHAQISGLLGEVGLEGPLVFKEWPCYGARHPWAGHEVICNDPMMFLLSHQAAETLVIAVEQALTRQQWSPADWLVPEIIHRQSLPIYLCNTAKLRLVGAPFQSLRTSYQTDKG